MTSLALLLLLPARLDAADPGAEALDALLQAHVHSGRVDYEGLAREHDALHAWRLSLAEVDLASLTREERMAFWINAYNGLTLDLVVENLPLSSIRDLDGGDPWSRRVFRVGGADHTLDRIEHRILRPMGDPRVHAAINCASRGCPPLSDHAFRGTDLDARLDAAARAWVRRNAARVDPAGTVYLSRIFDWFGEDFIPRYGPALRDLPGLSGRKEAAINFLVAHGHPRADLLLRGGLKVRWADYDWSLNGL